ncbi:hypothetical protein ACHWQZ_G013432 [Mnemiopsis leidyi]
MSFTQTFYRCECILFLFVFAVTIWQALLPQFIYTNILDQILSTPRGEGLNTTTFWNCRYYGDLSLSTCSEMAREKLAQRETSRIMVSLYVVGEVIGVTISLKWASISDRFGRKWPMVASCLAQGLFTMVLFLFLIKPLSKWWLIGAYLTISLTGGSLESILIGTKSLISDTCGPTDRTPCLAVNESLRRLAQFLGFTLSGALINYLGASFVCFGCMGAFFVLTVHCLLLPDTRARSGDLSSSYSQILRHYYTHPRYGSGKRAKLSICFSILGRLSFSAPQNLFVMYLISEPFYFNSTLIGVFLGYKTLGLSVICFIYTVVPSNILQTIKDSHMMGAGLTLLAASYILFIFTTTTTTLFLGATLHGMFGLAAVSFNSLLSKSVPEGQLAHTFAITTGLERLLLCVAAPAVGVTHQQTKTWSLHGFCFFIPLLLTVTSGIILAVFWEQFSNQSEVELGEVLPLCQSLDCQTNSQNYSLLCQSPDSQTNSQNYSVLCQSPDSQTNSQNYSLLCQSPDSQTYCQNYSLLCQSPDSQTNCQNYQLPNS